MFQPPRLEIRLSYFKFTRLLAELEIKFRLTVFPVLASVSSCFTENFE